MPATSKAQQAAAAIALHGKPKKGSSAEKMKSSMSKEELTHLAKTKGLKEHMTFKQFLEERSKPEKEMKRSEAFKKDKHFYADRDNDIWCVFGDSSGFCYASPGSEEEAKKIAKEMNDQKKGAK